MYCTNLHYLPGLCFNEHKIIVREQREDYCYSKRYCCAIGEAGGGKSILERELAPLESIRDHNPKYLLTMDFTPNVSHNGIKQMNALDWLLED
jgi:hypothetical protein